VPIEAPTPAVLDAAPVTIAPFSLFDIKPLMTKSPPLRLWEWRTSSLVRELGHAENGVGSNERLGGVRSENPTSSAAATSYESTQWREQSVTGGRVVSAAPRDGAAATLHEAGVRLCNGEPYIRGWRLGATGDGRGLPAGPDPSRTTYVEKKN
jgi:hypothetical protein